ncbi:TonB-dependent receptor [Psychrobacter lutiphocae]|uniref:hypothetical protein n=1 Tax=Psychrobacter lutiphocae TaxID=540500 RepID=UPI00036F9C13|nr:hypothetical protein [Psychrobacter lutiphocae]
MNNQTTLRLMIFASLPGIGGGYGMMAHAALSASPSVQTAPSTLHSSIFDERTYLTPSLVGIYVNGQEVDALEVLYDSGRESSLLTTELTTELTTKHTNTATQQNDAYYLSLDDLIRLTGVEISANPPTNDAANGNTSSYSVSTPIGDTHLTADQVIVYQDQRYLALSHLKKLGITADYNQADLAVSLNMGWQPDKIKQKLSADDKTQAKQQQVDYYPNRFGLLGLSFNSSLTASENVGNAQQASSTNRQMYADIGAFGYGLGGVWGIRALGIDSHSEQKTQRDDLSRTPSQRFSKTAFDGFSYLPSEWDDWQLDNVYWAKSGQQIATRVGVNRPNSLGQGVQTSSSEFTGALVAYSNRDIERHLSFFDDTSHSLLQNTSQDYQHISGTGEPGGVAELRIDGRALARVQIGLDGRYEFLNLDVSQVTLADTLIEIAIFAHPLARQPLEVRPIFLGKRRTNTATDELLIEAGIGRSGNLFNKDNNEHHDTAAHVYAEYGVTNRLAIRGGLNHNLYNQRQNSSALSWHAGLNYTPSVYTNLDVSHAHMPNQQLWQAQLQYQRRKLWANYQYNYRQFDASNSGLLNNKKLRDERHQLLLNYRPNNKTSVSLNQYYDDLARHDDLARPTAFDRYHAYASVSHQFSPSLNANINWDTRGDRYNYRLLWQDKNLSVTPRNSANTHNTFGLSGDNDSDTFSLRHYLNEQLSLGQSISYHHHNSKPLYQGDMSYRFIHADDPNQLSRWNGLDNLVSIGYSLYDNHLGWQADWQLTHRNSVNFSLGYKHRYVDSIPTERLYGLVTTDGLIGDNRLPAWQQNNYLYAKLSFDMFKAPKRRLQLGNYPRQNLGSVVVDIAHPAEPSIDNNSMRFTLNDQKVDASLLGANDTHSQYLISNIKAGDYTLKMDAKNLPLEYSTSEVPTPRIRVSNYSPTSVPLALQKTYGISGKLMDGKAGVEIGVYQGNQLIQSATSGNFGYFQIFGLPSATYTLKSADYQEQKVVIDDDFVMQFLLLPTELPAD